MGRIKRLMGLINGALYPIKVCKQKRVISNHTQTHNVSSEVRRRRNSWNDHRRFRTIKILIRNSSNNVLLQTQFLISSSDLLHLLFKILTILLHRSVSGTLTSIQSMLSEISKNLRFKYSFRALFSSPDGRKWRFHRRSC